MESGLYEKSYLPAWLDHKKVHEIESELESYILENWNKTELKNEEFGLDQK
eukprot:CAMPEP_0202969500 /NCGR_PEP_ID=MMETSP1396-20130829/15264_1 /ASSEMBLY_ACC=CAM_ASM_000872 /TAXON_ID= /ORGANISM="Pseudokeronopsis sp., Strain Brazil" /LENGTH=50 /DNA_ID=CAMNT_0049697135 /DNA_START=876 /DNA_END=1028 /DNA_ORIENTATION=+